MVAGSYNLLRHRFLKLRFNTNLPRLLLVAAILERQGLLRRTARAKRPRSGVSSARWLGLFDFIKS